MHILVCGKDVDRLNTIKKLTVVCTCTERLIVHMYKRNIIQFTLCSVLLIILHLINSSNERPLFVPRERPIFSRIGSKKVRIFFVLDD